jgi:chemotaxis protein MotB
LRATSPERPAAPKRPRRRSRHDANEHSDRWVVSYADFITLLFAFFVVMYAISTLNESKYRVISDALIAAFRNDKAAAAQLAQFAAAERTAAALPAAPPAADPAAIEQQARQQHLAGMADRLSEALEPLLASGGVRMTRLPHGIAIEINASLLFAPGQAGLRPDSIAALQAAARVLQDSDNAIKVEGHTDPLPIASAQYPSNWELSSARASSVVRVFAASGIRPSRLTATGYADNRPVESNATPEGRSRNRRVTLLVLEDGASPAEN